MGKHKQVLAVTDAARQAAKQLATLDALQEMGRKAMNAAERKAESANFAEFLLSGEGSKAIIRIGESVFRIEG